MSTRCNIHFTEGAQVVANIYRHSDGYPDGKYGVPADLERFFTAVEEQTGGDTRFDDPSYLAAKFIVWQAKELAVDIVAGRPLQALDFLGLGIVDDDAGDGEYIYTIDSSKRTAAGRPTVTWKEA